MPKMTAEFASQKEHVGVEMKLFPGFRLLLPKLIHHGFDPARCFAPLPEPMNASCLKNAEHIRCWSPILLQCFSTHHRTQTQNPNPISTHSTHVLTWDTKIDPYIRTPILPTVRLMVHIASTITERDLHTPTSRSAHSLTTKVTLFDQNSERHLP